MVGDETPIHIKNLYEARSVDEFKADLDFLLDNFRPISLQELIDVNRGKTKLKENCFHLTFDDGLREFYSVVAPILREKGIPATIFINTDFLDNKALFFRFKASILTEKYAAAGALDFDCNQESEIDELAELLGLNFRDYLNKEQPYLSSSEVSELIAQGFTIGAHSKNHPLYSEIPLEEQLEQTLTSVNKLVEDFKLDYKVFSFPFTDDGVSRGFFDEINKQVDLTFGTAGLKNDVVSFNLQRIPMEENKKGIEIIKSQYLYYLLKMFVGKNTIRR